MAKNNQPKMQKKNIVFLIIAIVATFFVVLGFVLGEASVSLSIINIPVAIVFYILAFKKDKKKGQKANSRKSVAQQKNAYKVSKSQHTSDDGDGDDIVTLTTAAGEDIDFVEIAGIAHKGNFYAILQPVELIEGMDDDEALVFKVTRKNGEDNFEIELDDDIIDAVFAEYNRLLDEAGY